MGTKCRPQRAILARLALVATLAVASAGATVWTMRNTLAEMRWVIHGHEALTGMERTLSLLERAEASRRGYLLTTGPRHREAFRHLVDAVGRQIDGLAALAADDARQQDHRRGLGRLVAAGLAAMRETIERHDQAGTAAVAGTDRDRSLVDPIRSVIASMQAQENDLLVRRVVAAETAAGVLIVMSILAATTSLLLVGLSYRLIAQELGRRQALECQLVELAKTDPLTGLPNRRALDEALESAASRARRYGLPLSVIVLDVDHFKRFNDTYGHEVGDAVLRGVGQGLRAAVRAENVAGRYGGDEFLVVLADTDEVGSSEVAERIRAATMALNQAMPPVTISLGIATVSGRANAGTGLVAEADRALAASKRGGRNRVTHCHDPGSTAGGRAPSAAAGFLA